ncbi:MAG: MFS transporter [Gemmatimonadaceae bacterium]|nr:MFS transporter [Chitinophagaceae bacterium]
MRNWKIKASLFLNYFVFAILLNSVGTVILQVQSNYNVSPSSASVLEAFKDLSIAFVSFFVATFLTRIGYKRAMLIALAFVTVVCLLMPVIPGFAMTKLLFAATGASFALIKVSVFATIGLVTNNKKDHASFMNFIESFFMVGILSGNLIFSAFVDDSNPSSTSWLKVYYLLAAIAAIAFVLLMAAPLDESAVKAPETKSPVKDFVDMIALAIKPLVLVFIISAFLYVFLEQSIMSWLPTYNNQVLHLPRSLSIAMASILAAATALGRFFAGFVLRRVHWLYVLIGCLVCAAALVLIAIPLAKTADASLTTGWTTAPFAAFIFPLIGFFIAPIYPSINSAILSTLPPPKHGPMSGLIVIFSALGGTTGSIITGHLFESYGGEKAFYFSLVPMTILLFALIAFNRLQKKQTQTLNTGG